MSIHLTHDGNLNTLAVMASKEVFHKSALLGVPHIKNDFIEHKQENIRKTLEIKPLKKLWSAKILTHVIKEPIHNFEKDPFRNVDLLVDSSSVTRISSSKLGVSFQETNFTTPLTEVEVSTAKIMDQNAYEESNKDLQSAFGTNKPSPSTPVASAVETLSTNVPVYSQMTSTINTPDTSTVKIQSVTFISRASYNATTVGSPASPTTSSFQESSTNRNCRRLQVTSSPPETTGLTSPSMEVLTVSTHLIPDTNHTNKATNVFSRPNMLRQFLRNVTLSTSADYGKEYKRSNRSDPTHALDSPAWKDLPTFPTKKHRPVCPYPPLPSHGTFYFRSVKNPGPHQYKHYIQYACYPGYTLTSGDVYSYCQHNGQWSGKTPLCLGKIWH